MRRRRRLSFQAGNKGITAAEEEAEEEGRLSLSRYPLPRIYSEHIAEKPEGTVLCIQHILDGQNTSKGALQFSS